MAEQKEGRLKFSTLAILIGSGVALASTNGPTPPNPENLIAYTSDLNSDNFILSHPATQWPTNQPHPPKLAISMGRIERDVCATNTTYYWPDGPKGETKWTYIDASRELILRVNKLQTNVTVPVMHIQWLMRLNKATGEWSYFVGSEETNLYAPPSGFVMQFPPVKKQVGLKNVPPPPTPK